MRKPSLRQKILPGDPALIGGRIIFQGNGVPGAWAEISRGQGWARLMAHGLRPLAAECSIQAVRKQWGKKTRFRCSDPKTVAQSGDGSGDCLRMRAGSARELLGACHYRKRCTTFTVTLHWMTASISGIK